MKKYIIFFEFLGHLNFLPCITSSHAFQTSANASCWGYVASKFHAILFDWKYNLGFWRTWAYSAWNTCQCTDPAQFTLRHDIIAAMSLSCSRSILFFWQFYLHAYNQDSNQCCTIMSLSESKTNQKPVKPWSLLAVTESLSHDSSFFYGLSLRLAGTRVTGLKYNCDWSTSLKYISVSVSVRTSVLGTNPTYTMIS